MRKLSALFALLVFLACGSSTVGEESRLDEIRNRINMNACRINREDLVFAMGELEFIHDTVYAEIPDSLLLDSLLVCPVTGERYILENGGDSRTINCPSGHGRTDL